MMKPGIDKVNRLIDALDRPIMVYRFARSDNRTGNQAKGAEKRMNQAAADIDKAVRKYLEEET